MGVISLSQQENQDKKKEQFSMKKFLSMLLATVVMCVSLTFVGCKKGDENFSLSGVVSNGGLGVIKEGYLYYINGTTTELETEVEQVVTSTSIFKVKVDANGNKIAGEEPQIVYRGVAGFAKSSLHIFGDYIYFALPSTKVSNSATRLSKRTSFARVKLDGSGFEVLYTTETEDALKYEFYAVSDTEMHLVVLEGKELYSLNIAKKKIKKNTIATEVDSVAFSSTNGRGNGAEPYVFYTKAPASTYLTQNGNIVFKATPDGKVNTKISSGESVTLLQIKGGNLFFSVDKKIYKSTTAAGLDRSSVVSYNAYTKYLLLDDGGIVGVDETNSKTVKVEWENGALIEAECIISDKSYTLMLENGTYLLCYNSSKVLYAAKLGGQSATPKKLTDEKVAVVDGYLTYEIFGDYLYYYTEKTVKDSNGNDVKLTSLTSINIHEAYTKPEASK